MNDMSPAAPRRTYSGIAASERAVARRQRFIAAGIELFGSIGYHATTMRTLTAATGLTNRYFYESFATMEELLMACYEKLMDDYRARLNQVLYEADDGLELRCRAGLRCFFEAMADPCFARITHIEVLGVSPRVDDLYIRSTNEFAALMMGFLDQAGVPLAAHDPRQMEIVGSALAGAVIHTGALWVRSRYATPVEVVVEAALKVILGTVSQLRVEPAGPGARLSRT